ncbi:hypothetical protein TSOC_011489 [Tetrabaena socialis]|uniref:Uncharacterized protein n=1 Tax=Tetrabaena socialis TaxID=47790 RepID=A0A2J7ZQI2_9CHLO|nr:hypothetical protein TSOC_011489 [Tetrabaena socialis]|eukprot:PNH02524.1 hypothetical protein TSOC_011489 [Tetrabaena socialis]
MMCRTQAREAAHKPPPPSGERGDGKAALYARLLDPNSDWPEPQLKGDHLEAVMREWAPSSPPSSPGGGGAASSKKKRGKGTSGSKRLPVAGVRGGVEARDEPSEVNQDVGELLGQAISPHKDTHIGGAGFGAR